ncbi:MAG: DMT family transporter [Candidatus Anammoximicrobium sp.]|nr:DMT family transporter [Candidatus Anammoximicrobium sp.]
MTDDTDRPEQGSARLNPDLAASASGSRHAVLGTLYGLFSAVGYTAANACLRAVSDCDPIWVSAVKAFPTLVMAGPWVAVQAWRGRRIWPGWRVLGLLAMGALVAQVIGNVIFQWSLGVVGLALAVPLTLGTMILGGALLGRTLLHEPLTLRMAAAVVTLIAAVTALSLGAGDAHRSVAGPGLPATNAWWQVALGVAGAMLAGLSYSILGVVIRYGVKGRASLSITLLTVSTLGVISLGGWSVQRVGWRGMWDTPLAELGMMVLAGIFNAVAFLALTKALQLVNLVYVHALNATQATMAALAGVLIFHEAPSPELAFGVLLTIVGLLLMKQRTRAARRRPLPPVSPKGLDRER